jgi:hypothetical protein
MLIEKNDPVPYLDAGLCPPLAEGKAERVDFLSTHAWGSYNPRHGKTEKVGRYLHRGRARVMRWSAGIRGVDQTAVRMAPNGRQEAHTRGRRPPCRRYRARALASWQALRPSPWDHKERPSRVSTHARWLGRCRVFSGQEPCHAAGQGESGVKPRAHVVLGACGAAPRPRVDHNDPECHGTVLGAGQSDRRRWSHSLDAREACSAWGDRGQSLCLQGTRIARAWFTAR